MQFSTVYPFFESNVVLEICASLSSYLLMLLGFQFDGRLDAVAGVVVCLFKSQIHQVFVIGSRHVSTDEDDDVSQDLHRHVNSFSQRYIEILHSLYSVCHRHFS